MFYFFVFVNNFSIPYRNENNNDMIHSFQFLQRTMYPFIVLLVIFSFGNCYQYVKFVNNPTRKISHSRNSRSFGHFYPIISQFPELWPEEILWPHGHILEYTIETTDNILPNTNHVGT